MSLDEIGRDSFISWRQLQQEAQHSFNNLIEQMASTHITSLNLVTAISCTCNIARLRPEKMPDVSNRHDTNVSKNKIKCFLRSSAPLSSCI
jgi:hypothetical protein